MLRIFKFMTENKHYDTLCFNRYLLNPLFKLWEYWLKWFLSGYKFLWKSKCPFHFHSFRMDAISFAIINLVVVVILFPEEYNRTHSICTTFIKSFHKRIPLAVAREAEAHRTDNRYFNNDTAGGKQGGYFIVPRCVEHITFSKWVVQYQWVWYLLIVLWYNMEQISMISWQ